MRGCSLLPTSAPSCVTRNGQQAGPQEGSVPWMVLDTRASPSSYSRQLRGPCPQPRGTGTAPDQSGHIRIWGTSPLLHPGPHTAWDCSHQWPEPMSSNSRSSPQTSQTLTADPHFCAPSGASFQKLRCHWLSYEPVVKTYPPYDLVIPCGLNHGASHQIRISGGKI